MDTEAGKYPITRHLPKTGQTTVYQANDDGTFQAGWWRGRTVSGNKTRFLSKTISGDAIVVDRATGLIWPKDLAGAGGNNTTALTWSEAITWAAALSFAGFTDWRLPNIIELLSIGDFEKAASPRIYSIFDNPPGYLWSSTTYKGLITSAFLLDCSEPKTNNTPKAFENRVLAVRDSRL